MKHFKHLKPGMSLIEVVAAIGILAIFGSSIFLMQQFLFDRMLVAQTRLVATLRMQGELIIYQTNILKEFFEQAGPVEKSLKEQIKNFKQPDMTIKVTTKSDLVGVADQKESPFKDFKNLYLICVQAEQDFSASNSKTAADSKNEYGRSYIFAYIPEVAKK
jgi:prepilin-type N-terminal cleavage/methylation domain-containing protein